MKCPEIMLKKADTYTSSLNPFAQSSETAISLLTLEVLEVRECPEQRREQGVRGCSGPIPGCAVSHAEAVCTGYAHL